MKTFMKACHCKKFFSLLITVVMVFSFIPMESYGASPEWDGSTADTSWYTEDTDVFTIDSAEELAGLAKLVNDGNPFSGKTIKLAGNIALDDDGLYTIEEDVYFQDTNSDYSGKFPVPTLDEAANLWTPVGTLANSFRGTFDGDGHTISGLYTNVANSYQGLFGAIGVGACIKDVTVSGAILGKQYVGGIAGYANGATIEDSVNDAVIYASGGAAAGGKGDKSVGHVGGILGLGTGTEVNPVIIVGCTNNGTVTCPNCYKGGRAGGIVGIFDLSGDYAQISQCINNGDIKTYQYAGGIVGGQFASNVSITSCYNAGDITGTSSGMTYAGGIAGKCGGSIINCYNTGNIFSTATTGSRPTRFAGIVGETAGSTATVANCYSIGTINKAADLLGSSGNIIGSQASNPINCYYLNTNSLAEAGDLATTTAKTASQFKSGDMPGSLSEYFAVDSNGENNGYPVLRWQKGLNPVSSTYIYTIDPDVDPIWTIDVDSPGLTGGAIYDDTPVTVTVTRSEKAYASSLSGLVVMDSQHHMIDVEAGTPVSGGYNTVKGCTYTFTMPESAVTIRPSVDNAALKVYSQVGTGAAVLVKTYSREDMMKLATDSAVYYTGYDSMPAAVIGKAEKAVILGDLLKDAKLSFVSGGSIKLNSIDSYPATFTYQDLAAINRYYYPNLNEETGKDIGKKLLEPMLVIKGYQSRFSDFSPGQDIDDMKCDTLNAYRFVFGQTEKQFNNGTPDQQFKTVGSFAKWTNSLTVVSPEPPKNDEDSKSGGGGGGGGVADTGANLEKDSSGSQRAVVVTNANAKTDAAGKAAASVTKNTLSSALEQAAKAAEKADSKAGQKSGTTAVEVKVEIKTDSTAKAVEAALPVDTLKEMAKQANTMLTVSSPVADITLDQDALAAIVNKAGSQVTLSAEKVDSSSLPAETKEKIGDAPVYDLKVLGSSGTISDFKGGKATVSVPYELKQGENPAQVAVYYINSAGEIEKVNCIYNSSTKTVTFTTGHFSYYAVVVEAAATNFSDVKQTAYYSDAVNFAVKKGLFNGTTDTTFSPDAGMTRAMFVTVLGRASGVNAADYKTSSFGDVKEGSWYAGYVQWAYENKIVSGVGSGKFAPEQMISRAQMASILTNYCKWKGISTGTATTLTYTDLSKIPGWASEGVGFCTTKGWLTGYPDGSFMPDKKATRAEAVTVLYKGSGNGLL